MILYSSENNIDCKLLITKTKEQNSGRKINIGVVYIIHCVLALLMLKNTLTHVQVYKLNGNFLYTLGKTKISLITSNCLNIFFC